MKCDRADPISWGGADINSRYESPSQRDDIDTFCVPLVDGPGNHASAVRDAVHFVDEVVDAGERILVHCHAGRSRSVAVVIRTLMLREGLSRSAATSIVAERREIWLTPGIETIFSVPLDS